MDKFKIFRLVSMLVIFVAYRYNQPTSPAKDPPHRYRVLDEFLSDEQHRTLMTLFEEMRDFPDAKQDWTSTKWISVGEDYEPSPDGSCPQTYTILNTQTNRCQLPNRIDIGKHFVETGGYNGWKETYPKMLRRLHPFINYQFDASKRPEFKALFTAPAFEAAVREICGEQNPYFRPFQLSLILNVPGQSVPMHLDIPYFWHATRYAFPQWLLLVMQDSGLFAEHRLPQVQALLYVHDWNGT